MQVDEVGEKTQKVDPNLCQLQRRAIAMAVLSVSGHATAMVMPLLHAVLPAPVLLKPVQT